MSDRPVDDRLVKAWSHRVRYYETDSQRIVFNMWFLAWCDEAFAAWVAFIGVPYEDLVARGMDMQLVRAELEFSSPLAAGDEIDVLVGCERVGNSSFVIRFELMHGDVVAAVVRITYVMIGTDGSGPMTVPEDVRAIFLSTPRAGAI